MADTSDWSEALAADETECYRLALAAINLSVYDWNIETGVIERPSLGRDVQRLIAWSSSTETGDRDEVTPGVPDRSWSQVSVSARECIGVARCPFGTDCFAEKARDKAGHADVVVTNHALLAIDAMTDAAVLPEHRLLVVDEAHELVDRVTGVATAELSATSLGVR